MRFFKISLLWAVPVTAGIAVLWYVSARANFHFGLSLGSDLFGYASLSADVTKAFALFGVFAAIALRRYLVALTLTAIWLLCTVWSVGSAVGFMSLHYATMTDDRGKNADNYTLLKEQIARLEERRRQTVASRPESVVKAEIEGLLQTPGAGDCSTINGPVTAKVCPEVTKLRAELGHAKSASWLDGRLDELRAEMKSTDRVTTVDPRAETIAAILGVSVASVTKGLAGFFAILLELTTSAGMWAVWSAFGYSRVESAEKPQEPPKVSPVSVAIHAPRRPAGLPDVIEKAQAAPRIEAPLPPEPETPPDGDGTPVETAPEVSVPEPTTVVNFPKPLSKREKAKQKKQRVEQENRALVESFVVDRLDTDHPKAEIELTSRGGHRQGGTSGDDIYQEFRRYCKSRGVPGVGKSHLGRFIGEFVDRARNHKGVVYGAVIRTEARKKVA